MTYSSKRFLLSYLCIFLLIGLTACSGKSSSGSSTSKEKTYKIGINLPLTGGEADIGSELATAFKMGVEAVNADGGVNGVPLEAVVEDSAADPNQAITSFRKLTDVDKVPIIAAAWSGVINAMAPLAEENKTLIFSVGAGSPNIKELGEYTRTFSVLADRDIQGMATYAFENLKVKKAAILYINNDTGKYAAKAYKETFEELGGKLVASESHNPGVTDFTAQISKIKEADPDIIHMHSLTAESPFIVKQIRSMGIDVPITTFGGIITQTMIDNAGEAAEGLMGPDFIQDPKSDPNVKAYQESWMEKQGRESKILGMSALYTDIPFVIRDIYDKLLADGKEINGENALAALKEIKKFEAPITGVTIFEDDRSVTKDTIITSIENGEIVTKDVVPAEINQ
jgi:branched-chain amino acid transport system substrate-binding protein